MRKCDIHGTESHRLGLSSNSTIHWLCDSGKKTKASVSSPVKWDMGLYLAASVERGSPRLAKPLMEAPPAAHLVTWARGTSLPAVVAVWKLWAPTVSMAMMGTSPQPTSCSPWTTPHNRPPPPTDSAMAPGFALSVSFSSFTMEVWPFLEGRRRWQVRAGLPGDTRQGSWTCCLPLHLSSSQASPPRPRLYPDFQCQHLYLYLRVSSGHWSCL